LALCQDVGSKDGLSRHQAKDSQLGLPAKNEGAGLVLGGKPPHCDRVMNVDLMIERQPDVHIRENR
jgi:hypothetical protein